MSGPSVFLLTVLVALFPVVQSHPHNSSVLQMDDYQHAAKDARHFATFSDLSTSTQNGKRLFSYTGLIALPPVVDLFLTARSSTKASSSIVWLLEATVRPRAPPSLKP